MVGLFVELESPPSPGTEERTKQANASSKHLTSSVGATYMTPYFRIQGYQNTSIHQNTGVRIPFSWLLRNIHLWLIPVLMTVWCGMATTYHGVSKRRMK